MKTTKGYFYFVKLFDPKIVQTDGTFWIQEQDSVFTLFSSDDETAIGTVQRLAEIKPVGTLSPPVYYIDTLGNKVKFDSALFKNDALDLVWKLRQELIS